MAMGKHFWSACFKLLNHLDGNLACMNEKCLRKLLREIKLTNMQDSIWTRSKKKKKKTNTKKYINRWLQLLVGLVESEAQHQLQG